MRLFINHYPFTISMNSLLRNISWLALGNALAKPVWLFFIVVVCVRELGEEGYGIFTATLALAAIARSLTDFGITPYSIREVARRQAHASRYLSNFLSIKVGLSLLSLGGALAVGGALGYTGGKFAALVFATAYMMALGLTDYFRAYYRAFEQMQYEAVSVVVEKGLVIGVGVVFLVIYETAAAVLGGMALGMFATLLLNLWWTTTRFAAIKTALLSPTFLKRALPAAIPLGLAGQFVVIYFRTDAVMVDAMVSTAAAGQYGEAYRLLEAVAMITALVTAAIYPRLSSLFKDKRRAEFTRIFSRSALSVTGIGLAVAVGLFVFAAPLMRLLTGGEVFAPAAEALKILAWAAPFMAINYVLSVTLNASDDQNRLAWVLGGAALFNVALNFVVIPLYSFYGACASTLATEALITMLLGLRYLRHTRFLMANG